MNRTVSEHVGSSLYHIVTGFKIRPHAKTVSPDTGKSNEYRNSTFRYLESSYHTNRVGSGHTNTGTH